MRSSKQREKTRENLASSTTLMILNLSYLLTICWIVPVEPIIIVWIFDIPFSSFIAIWGGGLPCLGLIWYLFRIGTKHK